MEVKLNDYHKKVNAEKKASVAYWQAHPLSREECLKKSVQLVRLRQWAQEQGCWFEDRSLSPRFSGESV